MDYSYEKFEAFFPSMLHKLPLQGSSAASRKLSAQAGYSHSDSDENLSKDHVFNPELVIAHCFKQFKQKDFHLPRSRRRIIILPQEKYAAPVDPTPQPQAPTQSIPSSKAPEVRDIPEPPEDVRTWMSRRLKCRQELETFGNIDRWLQNKRSLTRSEAKILRRTHEEQPVAPLMEHFVPPTPAKKKSLRRHHLRPPQLRLPKPSALFALYSFLRGHNLKILDIFAKVDLSNNQTISREMFITALKVLEVPLRYQEIEDVVIYLSSLGKHNKITLDSLLNTYKQWAFGQPKSKITTKDSFLRVSRSRVLSQQLSKKQATLPPKTPKMDHLKVPMVNTKMEARPLTLEEMEDIGKRYRQRKRQAKLTIPSIQYTEQCRLVRSGNKHFDSHCLPSTIPGEMGDLLNLFRRDTFLVYLKCQKACQHYGLQLSEDVLMKALLYPGDKIISQMDQVRPIRQPGGYYSDLIPGSTPALFKALCSKKSMAKKMDKNQPKEMNFEEFEKFARKLKEKSPYGTGHTHPNFFWPGHLLDKLQLYLPSVTVDRSLMLFSCVQQRPPAYPVTCHSHLRWPIRNRDYMTCAYSDAPKVVYSNQSGPGDVKPSQPGAGYQCR